MDYNGCVDAIRRHRNRFGASFEIVRIYAFDGLREKTFTPAFAKAMRPKARETTYGPIVSTNKLALP